MTLENSRLTEENSSTLLCVCVCILSSTNNFRFMYVVVWIEIEHHSVVYFNCVAVFEVLWYRTSVKDGSHTCCEDASNT